MNSKHLKKMCWVHISARPNLHVEIGNQASGAETAHIRTCVLCVKLFKVELVISNVETCVEFHVWPFQTSSGGNISTLYAESFHNTSAENQFLISVF